MSLFTRLGGVEKVQVYGVQHLKFILQVSIWYNVMQICF